MSKLRKGTERGGWFRINQTRLWYSKAGGRAGMGTVREQERLDKVLYAHVP